MQVHVQSTHQVVLAVMEPCVSFADTAATRVILMVFDEAVKSVETGIDLAWKAAAEGVELLGIGEMGIGSTTIASAVAATLNEFSPDKVTGRGAGLDDDGLRRKIAAAELALEINRGQANSWPADR